MEEQLYPGRLVIILCRLHSVCWKQTLSEERYLDDPANCLAVHENFVVVVSTIGRIFAAAVAINYCITGTPSGMTFVMTQTLRAGHPSWRIPPPPSQDAEYWEFEVIQAYCGGNIYQSTRIAFVLQAIPFLHERCMFFFLFFFKV
jgi:hypothetical protein